MNIVRLHETLRRDEGFRSRPYRDSVGKLTIAYGWNIDDVPISEAAAQFILGEQVNDVLFDLDRALPFWRRMPEDAQQALANMAFQLGLPRLLRFVKMIDALEAGDFDRAADECLDSLYAKQTPARASRVAALMRECAPSNL
jgi:lysozyme